MSLFYILVIVVVIVVVWYISTLNQLKRSEIKVEEALSGIDVALVKRYDVLTKMIEVVKAYAKHEKETLSLVIKLRENMSVKEKNEANASMTESFNKINVVAENYPELKASENYQLLERSIVDVEEHLQAARRLYNANVSLYNQLLASFPTNFVATSSGMKEKDFFELSEIERQNVDVGSDKKDE